MFRFFFKAFLLSFTALAVSWFFEGAFYTFHYSRANEGETNSSQTILPQPAIVQNLLKDTNVLLLGMAGKPYAAPYLTDTIIVGSFRANPEKLTLVSIPRDLLVKVPGGKQYVKINSLYELGKSFSPLEPEAFIKEKVEEITGFDIDYYALIDVVGLEKIIDFLGGIMIEVKKPIADPFFPGPNYSYEPFYLETGLQHLNGHDAVRFARSRYSPRGDFDRIERQHQLLQALQKSIMNQKIPLEDGITLFSELNEHVATNVSVKDIPSLVTILFSLDEERIEMKTLHTGPTGLLKGERTSIGASVLVPKEGIEEYGEIREFFEELAY